MKKAEILEKLVESGVVAVIRAENQDQATHIAEACALGSVAALEITFTVPGAKEVIEHFAKKPSHQILLGAGTVLDPETALSDCDGCSCRSCSRIGTLNS